MDRATYEQLDRIEQNQTEILNRVWLLLENLRPDVIVKAKKKIQDNAEKAKETKPKD